MTQLLIVSLLWLVCFAACVGGLLLPRCFSVRTIKIATVALGIVLAFLLFLPIMSSVEYHPNKQLEIKDTFRRSANINLILDLGGMTEKPITEGHYGGILRRVYNVDVVRLIPDFRNYNKDSMTILWAYEFNPKYITRNGETIHVSGIDIKDNQVYFAIVPATAIPSSCQIEFNHLEPQNDK